MLDWTRLVRLPESELAAHDVALVNLACTEGLPDAKGIDQRACVARLDQAAAMARAYTDGRMSVFHENPAAYDHSEALFRVLCMIGVLQHQFGVRYNPAKIPEEAKLETADTFIHGALLGEGGTCASLPVVYVAVGRRLGYPLKLVSTHGHLFFRWDDGGLERTNFEVNATGMNCFPDDYYRTGRYRISPQDEKEGCFLQSKTPRMELSGFLFERGLHLVDLGDYKRASESMLCAVQMSPSNVCMLRTAVRTLDAWEKRIRAKTPPPTHWPGVNVVLPIQQAYPAVPKPIEARMHLWTVVEAILDHPERDRLIWGPESWSPGRKVPPLRVEARPEP